jgi:hypothetical protein
MHCAKHLLIAVFCLALCNQAAADIPNAALVCDPTIEEVDNLRYMRSLTLDLTGNIP